MTTVRTTKKSNFMYKNIDPPAVFDDRTDTINITFELKSGMLKTEKPITIKAINWQFIYEE